MTIPRTPRRPAILRFDWRTPLLLVAVAAPLVAVGLWLGDGAWAKGALSTKAVIRCSLFALGGISMLLAGRALKSRHSLEDDDQVG